MSTCDGGKGERSEHMYSMQSINSVELIIVIR